MAAPKRTGEETRAAALRVAFDLFTRQGYEATSLREIADELGINKASLYYYFASKESLLRALFAERGLETEQVLAWLDEQPTSPDLLETAVLRWVEGFPSEKLRGIRFLIANPRLSRNIAGPESERIGSGLAAFAERLTGLIDDPTPSDALLVRMALLSINFAVEAAAETDISDEQIIATARVAARALIDEISQRHDD